MAKLCSEQEFVDRVLCDAQGMSYVGMSSDRKQLLMLAIIAKRLEAQEITAEPLVPTFSAEVSLNLARMQDDAYRYRWMRDHWMQVENPPAADRAREVIITFHCDKQAGESSAKVFDEMFDRLIKGE